MWANSFGILFFTSVLKMKRKTVRRVIKNLGNGRICLLPGSFEIVLFRNNPKFEKYKFANYAIFVIGLTYMPNSVSFGQVKMDFYL